MMCQRGGAARRKGLEAIGRGAVISDVKRRFEDDGPTTGG
jgi:hypothetical protein